MFAKPYIGGDEALLEWYTKLLWDDAPAGRIRSTHAVPGHAWLCRSRQDRQENNDQATHLELRGTNARGPVGVGSHHIRGLRRCHSKAAVEA